MGKGGGWVVGPHPFPHLSDFFILVGVGRVVGIGILEILSLNFHIFTCIFNKIRLQLDISMTFDLKRGGNSTYLGLDFFKFK